MKLIHSFRNTKQTPQLILLQVATVQNIGNNDNKLWLSWAKLKLSLSYRVVNFEMTCKHFIGGEGVKKIKLTLCMGLTRL